MATIRNRGLHQWQAQIRRSGYPNETKTFNTRAEAEAWVRMTESEMDRGIFVSLAEAERTTLREALGRYEQEISRKKHDVLKQRIFQIASGYEDGNDSNSLRHDPMFCLGQDASRSIRNKHSPPVTERQNVEPQSVS